MDPFEELKTKIEEAVRRIRELKEDRENLLAELEVLRRENERAKRLARENEAFRKAQTRFKTRLERISNKISQVQFH